MLNEYIQGTLLDLPYLSSDTQCSGHQSLLISCKRRFHSRMIHIALTVITRVIEDII